MDDMKLLSTEAEGVNEAIPEEHRISLVNAQGRVGALLGLQDRQDEGSKTSGESWAKKSKVSRHSSRIMQTLRIGQIFLEVESSQNL